MIKRTQEGLFYLLDNLHDRKFSNFPQPINEDRGIVKGERYLQRRKKLKPKGGKTASKIAISPGLAVRDFLFFGNSGSAWFREFDYFCVRPPCTWKCVTFFRSFLFFLP